MNFRDGLFHFWGFFLSYDFTKFNEIRKKMQGSCLSHCGKSRKMFKTAGYIECRKANFNNISWYSVRFEWRRSRVFFISASYLDKRSIQLLSVAPLWTLLGVQYYQGRICWVFFLEKAKQSWLLMNFDNKNLACLTS